MKIALIGYGKMGRAIETLALAAGHELVARVDMGQWDAQAWRTADVALEFTHPEFGAEHVTRLLDAGIPVVCGTTGWNHQLPEVEGEGGEPMDISQQDYELLMKLEEAK
jgi:4-hydroxy-tetrahydrodipicolinate reductase